MEHRTWIAALLCAAGAWPVPAVAQPAAAPRSARAAASAAAAGTEIEALRREIERLRREAEEARRQQEERIRALEEKLLQLQKPPAPAPEPVTTRPGLKTRLYGYARADVDLDSRKMFAGPHLPFWVLSPDDPRAANRRDGAFTIHPRLTRLGLDSEAPPLPRLGDARLTGKLEVDFFNFVPGPAAATSNSRQFIRLRHGYGRLDWDHGHLLFGQTWDLISPLFPAANFDVVMWNAGNLGDRRPQIRGAWEPAVRKGRASLALAILAPDAVGGSNRDLDLTPDGEESDRPLLQARAALTQPSWVDGQNWELGVWGHNGRYRFDRSSAVNGRRSFTASAAGLDVRIPITKRLLFQGEGWLGQGLADVRGGIGQDINAITGETVHARGGWAELLYRFSDLYTLGGGFTLDDPDDEDVTPFTGANETAVGRTLNRSYYVVNRFTVGSLLLGIDWMLFNTRYRGLRPGSSNRWNLWVQHNF